MYHYTLKCCSCHLHIMSISAIYSNSNRNALSIYKKATFVPDLLLMSVGFGPVLFSPSGAFVIAPSIDCHFQLIPNFLSYNFKPSIPTFVWIYHLFSIPEIYHVQYWMHQDFFVVVLSSDIQYVLYIEDIVVIAFLSSILGRPICFFLHFVFGNKRRIILFHNASGISYDESIPQVIDIK